MSVAAVEHHVDLGVADRDEAHWRRDRRRRALQWLQHHSLSTTRDELWRYTAVEQVLAALGEARPADAPVDVDPGRVDELSGVHGDARIVLVNGVFSAAASHLPVSPGLRVAPFSTLDEEPDVAEEANRPRADAFVVLNQFSRGDAVRIDVDPGASPGAVHVVHLSVPVGDTRVATHPALAVRVGRSARIDVVETYAGSAGAGFANASTVLDVGEDASLGYRRMQVATDRSVHVGHVRATVARGGTVEATSLSLGGQVSRVALDVALAGEGASATLDGLHLPVGDQRHDHVVTVDHAASHTTSDQRFKAVVDDRARGSFTGHVLVRPDTAGVTAHQSSRNLLLTSQAEADTRPWLEILSDDVRCAHGATVGRLDDDALFYLRSRGIPLPRAREVLIEAFLDEVLDTFGTGPLREHAAERVRRVRSSGGAKR